MNERQIFDAALALTDPTERTAFLERACGDTAQLRRLQELLEAQNRLGNFLESPPVAASPTIDQPPLERPGVQIGPYKLVEQIGEGGMGAVWMAQQSEPVKRLVALKLIKAGMDSRQVIARFEAERQALALMDHPNIARVLDGGATGAGRPYFVMDLVRGTPITRYCDEHHLTPRQRLELFIPICQAIQHAHQKGIIHRDLKPSNVLVALYDGKPVPKVIDFGVAKAAGQPLTEQTLVTGFGNIVGTLEYMSPEQAEINQLDIDTRSDIYSLGVMLYELLTGSPPFSRKELEQAGMLEMLRVIREEEPSKPSTKLSTAEGLPTLAANRGTEPAKLTKLVRGELDWIVMKALEKDRARRYETANGFAQDVQRYLADEPVLACPPSAWYRFRKFARRNKSSLAIAAVLLFFLVVLAAGTSLAAVHFQRLEARQRALAESNKRLAEEKEQQRFKAMQAQGEAEIAQKLAEGRAEQLRRNLYVTELNFAFHAAEMEGGIARLDQLLTNWRKEKPDLRGWEWFYLHGLYHRDLLTISDFGCGVLAVAWSPEGGRLATADEHGHIRILDSETGKLLESFTRQGEPATSLLWNADGKYLAISAGADLEVWDLAIKKSIFAVRGALPVVGTWSPDGKRLAINGGEGSPIQIWDPVTGKKEFQWDGSAVCWAPDGQRVAFVKGRTIKLMELTTSEETTVETAPSTVAIQSLTWSPDGACLAWILSTMIFCHDLTQAKTTPFYRLGHMPNRLAWSPDGMNLASVDLSDRTVQVWDRTRKREVRLFRGHDGYVTSISWNPDGSRLASSSGDGTVKLWSVTDEPRASVSDTTNTTVCWNPRGTQLALGGQDGTIKICDRGTGEVRHTLRGHSGKVYSVSWSPDGNYLASVGDERVRVWDSTSGTEMLNLKGFENRPVSWSSDGKRLAFVSGEDTRGVRGTLIRVWDVSTKSEAFVLEGLDLLGPFGATSWSPDGKHLISFTHIHTTNSFPASIIHVWDLDSRKVGAQIKAHTIQVTSVCWSPDGTRLATASNDRTIKIWNLATGMEEVTLSGHSQSVWSIAWSPDGSRLASGSYQVVKIWDLTTAKEVLTLKTEFHAVGSLAWSPDGVCLAVAGDSVLRPVPVQIYDAARGYQLEGLPGPKFPQPRHAVQTQNPERYIP